MATTTDCVKVAVRVRPMVESEIEHNYMQIVERAANEPQIRVGGANSRAQENFTFNNVFMAEDPQNIVYEEAVQPIISKLFEGYNVTILAYGYVHLLISLSKGCSSSILHNLQTNWIWQNLYNGNQL